MIRTVHALVAPEDVGAALPHEHVLHRIGGEAAQAGGAPADLVIRTEDLQDYRRDPWTHGGRNLLLNKEDEAFRELERLPLLLQRESVGKPLVVDVTLPVEGRDALVTERGRLAQRLPGMHLVTVATFEMEKITGKAFAGLSPQEQSERVAKLIETELLFGINSEGESSGSTAKSSVSYAGALYQQIHSTDVQLNATEQILARGLALVQARTHAPLYLSFSYGGDLTGEAANAALCRSIHNWVHALLDGGAESRKLVVCHADRWCHGSLGGAKYEFLLSLFQLGLSILFDMVGLSTVSDVVLVNPCLQDSTIECSSSIDEDLEPPPDSRLAKWVASFVIQHKYLHQVMLSSNIHQRVQYQRYGGGGYTHVFEYLRPRLTCLGLTTAQWEQLVRGNAVELLAWYVAPEAPPVPKSYLQCTICSKYFEPIEGEYFTKFSFVYCGTKCLRRHSRQKFAPVTTSQ